MTWRVWTLIAAAVAGLVGLLYLSGVSPAAAGVSLVHGSMGSGRALTETLRETTPLLIGGIAVFVALQAGLFNIGVEGQLILGALTCTAVGLRIPGPTGLVVGTLAAMVAGCLWALPAGLIRAYRGGHEVITTIMLNSVAGFVATSIVAGPLKDPKQETPTTALLSSATRLPPLYSGQSLQVNSGLLIGLILLAAFAYWLKRYVSGYELRAVGKNTRAALLAGISPQRAIVYSMAISGAIAGLAGAVQVYGYEGRFFADFSSGYGFNSLGVALLAGSSPIAIMPAAFFFGAVSKGSASLQLLGVPKGASFVLLGVLIVAFAAVRYRRFATEAEE